MMSSAATVSSQHLSGIPGFAVRLGRALERWGAQAAAPLTRDELQQRRAEYLEGHAALAEREAAVSSLYRLG
jgi:hypothetical protein